MRVLLAFVLLCGTAGAATWLDGKPGILWKAVHEAGNTCEWNDSSCQPWASGPGKYSWKIVTSPVHSGRYALSSTIDTRTGDAGVRWPRRWTSDSNKSAGLPTTAYYSCWCYFPVGFSSDWYILKQWKSNRQNGSDLSGSDPCWTIGVIRKSDGKNYLRAYTHIGTDGRYGGTGIGEKARGTFYIVPGRWFHLESFYVWKKDKTGKLVTWIDGVKQWELNNVQTQYNRPNSQYPRQWTMAAYGSKINPSPHTLIIDDAAISTGKLFQ